MLKIKDNVLIEDLEKMGYEKVWNKNQLIELTKGDCTIELYDEIYHIWNTRIILVNGSCDLDEVYELIKADLVEKI